MLIIPLVVIFDSRGQEIKRRSGLLTPEEMEKWLISK
jgi:hypothetical protein